MCYATQEERNVSAVRAGMESFTLTVLVLIVALIAFAAWGY